MNIKSLFDSYNNAFDTRDHVKITALYTLPCATSDGDGQHVFRTEREVLEKFKTVCLNMKTMGCLHSEYKILKQESLGDKACAVTLGWKVHTENNAIEFRAHYICHKVEGQWKIFSAQVFNGTFE